MSTALTTMGNLGEAIEAALMTGDLSKLSIPDRMNYYNQVCKSLGLNPLTKPFSYIVLNGKLQMYATRDCTDQLRRVNGVSITALTANQVGDLYIVVAAAKDATGRTDQSTGAINILNLKGEALANALMKVETKAKRRVTLSLCGLGLLDETEIETLRDQGIAQDEGQEPPPVKHQVQMPRSTDEKKPQQGKAEAVQRAAPKDGPEQISGEIEKVSPGKGAQKGTLWLVVDKKVVCVPKELIDAEMVPGAKILLTVVEIKGGQVKKYQATAVALVVLPTQEGEIIDAEYAEVEDNPAAQGKAPDPVLQEARNAGLGGIFDDAPQAKPAPVAETTAEATKPGTIGIKRARRLYAIISQNHRNTGFSEEELKKVMSALPVPIEHLRDLELGLYEEFEKFATGETDYKNFWKD